MTKRRMKRSKKQGRKGKVHPNKNRVPKKSTTDKKAFFNEQCIKLEENNRREKTRDLFRKMGDFKDLPKDACNKGHKW